MMLFQVHDRRQADVFTELQDRDRHPQRWLPGTITPTTTMEW